MCSSTEKEVSSPTCSRRIVRKKYSEIVPKEAETASGAAPGGSGGVPASAQRASYASRSLASAGASQ